MLAVYTQMGDFRKKYPGLVALSEILKLELRPRLHVFVLFENKGFFLPLGVLSTRIR